VDSKQNATIFLADLNDRRTTKSPGCVKRSSDCPHVSSEARLKRALPGNLVTPVEGGSYSFTDRDSSAFIT
jgi:hypothetical protein